MAQASTIRRAAPAEFDRIYDDTFDFVYRNARRLGVPENAADDVTQEVFLVVYRRLADYDERATVRSWVYGILANTVRDYRRSFRRKQAPLVSREADELSVVEDSQNPERGAEQQREMRFLLGLLEELSEPERELIVLADLEQMSVPEICACIGGNPNTVYSRLRTARERLRSKLSRKLLSSSRKAGA